MLFFMLGTLASTTVQRASAAVGSLARTAVHHPWQGVKGIGKGTMAMAGVGLTAMSEGPEHGWGFGVAKGLAYLGPMAGIGGAVWAYDISYAALNYGHDRYKRSRSLEMFSPVQDLYGHSATMRQRSLHTLDRGRSVLGSEARMMR